MGKQPTQAQVRDGNGRFVPRSLPLAAAAAEAVLAGSTTAEIADALDISRVHAWRILKSAECQQIIIAVVNGRHSLLLSLFHKSLARIDQALDADRPTVTRRKGDTVETIEGGPDHYARLAAVARLLQVFTAGRPKPKAPEDDKQNGTMTLSQLEAQLDPHAGSECAGAGAPQPLR